MGELLYKKSQSLIKDAKALFFTWITNISRVTGHIYGHNQSQSSYCAGDSFFVQVLARSHHGIPFSLFLTGPQSDVKRTCKAPSPNTFKGCCFYGFNLF